MNDYYNNCVFYNEHDHLLDDFSRRVEEGSRYLINKYVKSDMKVLELGARYGTVSACFDYLLDNPPSQLLVVDPDKNIESCLLKNKTINNCSFNIFNGAISNTQLYVTYNGCGWETKTYIEPPVHLKSELIQTHTMNEIQEIYNIHFNCLLADCEGFLLQFIKENDSFFDNLVCVMYEEDCTINHKINNTYIDYNEIENFLLSKGFVLVETYTDFIGLNNKAWLKNV